jgi:succinate---hydroxymethylglutarate CoA-transferase
MRRPLEGVRIAAIEQYGAGPYGSQLLADLGAEIVKIENAAAGGDVSRATGPYFLGENDSQFFQTFSKGKRSLTLDLKSREGREVFHRLVAASDAVLNNLRGDQPGKLGLDYAALGAVKPGIVCAHLSAYGRLNSRAAWPGYDYLAQAEAGWMHLTGDEAGPPVRAGVSVVDFMTGTMMALGLVSAILGARASGQGCDVETSLFDVALHQLSYPATWYLNEGEVTGRLPRSAHPSIAPSEVFPTADGWLFVMCQTPKFWEVLCARLGREDLSEDARFATIPARRANRVALEGELDPVFRTRTTAEWLASLTGQVPVAPVNDLKQALDNPFVRETGMVASFDHRADPDLQLLASPLSVDGQRLGRPETGSAPAPAMGADTDALLGELGFSASEIAGLKDRRIV